MDLRIEVVEFVVFLASLAVNFLLFANRIGLARWIGDHTEGVQKIHSRVTPRVSGLSLYGALLLGALACLLLGLPYRRALIIDLVLAAAPVFLGGMADDITKRVGPWQRLALAFVSAALAVLLLKVDLNQVPWPWSTDLAVVRGGLLLLTLVAVAGVVNAVNIIDGVNGLASGYALLALASLAAVAQQHGDQLLVGSCVIVAAAVLGFYVFNFPNGHLFLGDGGAYLLGFVLAELAIQLLVRHPDVSLAYPVALFAYPVFEVMFSIHRRVVIHRASAAQPDSRHMHSLLYRVHAFRGASLGASATAAHVKTTGSMLVLASLAVVPATLWPGEAAWCGAGATVFVFGYLRLYRRLSAQCRDSIPAFAPSMH
jgi:UDP-N-acetylmuramyl pentapeptide phosphotransferase/UDP-N-acetylglucosamine-1-phosphate transferase